MSDPTSKTPVARAHITLRWLSHAPTNTPEIMVNLYGDSLAELEADIAEAHEIARARVMPNPLVSVPRPETFADAAAKGAAVRDEWAGRTRTEAGPEPICDNPECERDGQPLQPSKFTGLFCPGRDATQANGRCRSVAKTEARDGNGRARRAA